MQRSSVEAQYKRLQDLITALRYQESLERIAVSKASELLIAYCHNAPDPLIPYVPSLEGANSASVSASLIGPNPFLSKSGRRKRFLCF